MTRRRIAVLATMTACALLASHSSGGSPLARPVASRSTVAPSPGPSRPGSTVSSTSAPRPPAPGSPKPVTTSALMLSKLPMPSWPRGNRWYGPDGSMGSTGNRTVALTFDDGPSADTSHVLDLLDELHIKATFCLIGRQVSAYRSVVKRMISDGQTLCNHSWDHDEHLGDKSEAVIMANLQRTNDAIHAIDPAAEIRYFRHPGGNFTPVAVAVSEHLGMRPLYWDVDTRDWSRPGTDKIINCLRRNTRRGSIVLMHDGGGDRSETLAALRAVLPAFKREFTLVRLPTALPGRQ